MQSKPPINRDPLKCGRPDWPAHGRGPSQLGWYEWVAEQVPYDQVLDVGAGIGAGIAYLRYLRNDDEIDAPKIIGFDTDFRLSHFPKISIAPSLRQAFGEKQFNVVTCIDVIEHVVDDIAFFEELKQIARRRLYITTPNFTRSQCQNPHHAREYTFAEFAEFFRPDELWGGSADGWRRVQLPGPDQPSYGSPDGHEWESIAGVWNLENRT